MSGADCFPTRALISRDRYDKQILVPTVAAATLVQGMAQKAGLSSIYLFVVQSADYSDWGNVRVGSKWKLCQIGKTGPLEQEAPLIFLFHVKKRLPCDGL